MNKKDLVMHFAQKLGYPNKETSFIINEFMATIPELLKIADPDNACLKIAGHGTYYVVRRKGRTGRHPITGKAIKINAKNYVRFRPSKKFNKKIQW